MHFSIIVLVAKFCSDSEELSTVDLGSIGVEVHEILFKRSLGYISHRAFGLG